MTLPEARFGMTLLLSAAFLVACVDEPPVAPDAVPISLSTSQGDGSDAGSAILGLTENHIVQVNGTIPNALDDLIQELGGTVEHVWHEIGLVVTAGLSDEAAEQLAANNKVKGLQRDVLVQMIPSIEDLQWSLEATPEGFTTEGHDPTDASFFPFQWNMQIIDADDAWDAGYNDASGVRVAVIDGGIDPFHQDLAGLVDAASSIAFIPSLNPNGPAWGDDQYHGTHVAGTIASNGIGTAGVAPHATLIAIKACDINGGCSFTGILGGLLHAVAVDADVVNMSLSGSFPKAQLGFFVGLINKTVNYANSNGVLVVSAAGNQAQDLQHFGNFIRWPCEAGSGMCVSSSGPTDDPAYYTNFGTDAISVAGPGGDIQVSGTPLNDVVLGPCSSLSLVIPVCAMSPTFYVFLQGTSMASPHVAGAAALLDAQSGGAMNGGQLRSSLQNSADDLGGPGADPFFGKGRINVLRLLNGG